MESFQYTVKVSVWEMLTTFRKSKCQSHCRLLDCRRPALSCSPLDRVGVNSLINNMAAAVHRLLSVKHRGKLVDLIISCTVGIDLGSVESALWCTGLVFN
ncbi:hypothetical protein RRG08_019098 [Elysia crispata]|uniref:Uncharacterized protein n=1 Tax=Elysia crispata TaxID=231223 RepID=A0AAE1A5S0_9GAST|nr:hypothetical protein RRG08_019098 [Elysia crispata]